jgi:predicted alpha-1,6-mannanase (GH76 family)
MRPEARPPRRPTRARVLVGAVAAGLILALAACSAPGARAPAAPAVDAARLGALHARADAASGALLARFWDGTSADFAAASPSNGQAGGYWISALAVETLADAAERTGDPRYLDAVRAFVTAQDGRGWLRDWFDDEAWMAVALLRAHDVSGDQGFLDRAATLVDDIARSAPDASCCGVAPGGLWWDRPHTQKATAANAVPVIAAARLYERTGDGRWITFARDTYAYWRSNMVDASTGQVLDHVLPTGEQVWWRFTYDGGALAGAALALHHATGEAAFLDDARRFAGFLLAAETRPTPYGPVLFDGASCDGDCDAFKGIAHRYLADLASADPAVPGLDALLSSDGDAVWALARDPGADTFGVDWGAQAGPTSSLGAQASAAAALEVEAARAGPRPAAAQTAAAAR